MRWLSGLVLFPAHYKPCAEAKYDNSGKKSRQPCLKKFIRFCVDRRVDSLDARYFFSRLLIFLKIDLFEKFFQE